MDENKEFEQNETQAEEPVETPVEETAEETVEETVEEVAEVAEDVEETAEEFAEAIGEPAEEIAEDGEFSIELPEKKKNGVLITVITAIVVLAVLIGVGFATKILPWNKYNHLGYVNITGKTLDDIAKENNMELSDLLEEYGLPKGMKGNTEESAAYYSMPVKRIAKMYGLDFATMKEMLGFGDEVTEDTAWGEAEGEVTLEKYVGADYFEEFKKEYNFGDDITLETKWKEVRNTVDKASKKKYDEQKKAEEEAKKESEKTEAPVEEAPAEDVPSEETPAEETPAE